MVNTETATYENVLFSNEISNFDGTFSCKVSNVRGTAQETVVQGLNGESIVLCMSVGLLRIYYSL